MRKRIIIGFVAPFLLLSACTSGGSSSGDSTWSSPTPVNNLTAAQVAAGFKDAGNGLGYRWTTNTASSPGCDYGSCSTMEIVAYHACSSVYAEVNVLDASGTILGMTNDTASNMTAGDKAQLTFTFMEKSGTKVKLTELNCH